MPIDIKEAKAFIQSASKFREPWLQVAKQSWRELKNRTSNNKIWALRPTSSRKRYKYPAWYSIYKIRQPLVLSRAGEPVGRDTTADGNDPLGAAAALCVERLAINLAKTFDFYDVLCACRDDFLATNFGLLRAYYERDLVKERVKQYLTYAPDGQGGGEFLDEKGSPIETDDVFQDEAGKYYIETDQVIDVENERVCLEPLLYSDVYVDTVRRWARVKRLAFRELYSPAYFKEVFGTAAHRNLMLADSYQKEFGEDADKQETISVIEYWDSYSKEVIWFPEHGDETIEPLVYKQAKDSDNSPYNDDEVSTLNGLFNLDKFFPVPDPLVMNAPTDEFWPVPEYLQLQDWFEDIHSIFSKMVIATKAIRNRLIYDGSITGLKVALSELTESDMIGVNNLTQSLQASGGTLSAVAQYIPVEQIVNSLSQYYTALDQRLQQVYRITGTSDLLQGMSADQSGKTLGERQMEEKYATNQLSEPQAKMQKFVCNAYQLMVELAAKNFKDESLERYIIPETFPPDLAPYFGQALQLLKSNPRRFRVELETDSTIAINEQYDKAARIEIVNALTAALEKTAAVAQQSPNLATIELHALKFLIQGFRQGKLFQTEITTAIDNVIKQSQQPQPPPPDYEQMKMQLERDKLVSGVQVEQLKIQSDERLAVMKLQQEGQIAAIQNQLDQMRLQADGIAKASDIQLEYQKLQATISEAQQKLQADRDALMVEMRKVAGQEELAKFEAMIQQQTAPFQQALAQQQQQIDMYELQLREADLARKAQERQMIDVHTATDNVLQKLRLEIDAQKLALETRKPPEMPPITINMPQPATTSKKIKVERDAMGNISKLATEDVQEPSA